MFNSGNKPIVKAQESLYVKDRVKSPSQCVLTFSKSNESFNHRDHPIIAAKTNNFNHGNNNNKFEIKSPNKMDLNPNMFQKRKHSELTYTKALNFDKDTISGLEHKNPTINMGSFMLKNNLK